MNEMTEKNEQQCMRLQRNDQTLSNVTIYNINNITARRYGQGLQQNTSVNELRIEGSTELTLDDDNDDVDLLLKFIATSQSLELFSLSVFGMLFLRPTYCQELNANFTESYYCRCSCVVVALHNEDKYFFPTAP
jgi:hypothetical protein